MADNALSTPDVSDDPFVGRQSELDVILGALNSTGQRRVVFLSGEAGIGKTRLLLEAASVARTSGWLTLFGGAYDSEGMPAYLPFIEALKRYAIPVRWTI